MSNDNEVLKKIKSNPHWRINIRPIDFKKDRFESLSECFNLIEKNKVALRGWGLHYPNIEPKNKINGSEWTGCWIDYDEEREYWRTYQSGQFIHLKTFREDLFKEIEGAASRVIRDSNFTPSGYLDITSSVCFVTEIFEFASRLAQNEKFETPRIQIKIELIKIKNRMLIEYNFRRMWRWCYYATSANLEYTWTFELKDLIANSDKRSLEAIVWILERFGWHNPNIQSLEDDQRKLLSGNI